MRSFAKRILGSVSILAVFCTLVLARNTVAASFVWDPSPDVASGKVLGYKFYYSTQSFTSLPADVASNPIFTVLTVTNGTSVNITNFVSGQTYFMAVTAFGDSNKESLPSNILSYTENGANAKPRPPTNVIVK
jgi:hypothetical protein